MKGITSQQGSRSAALIVVFLLSCLSVSPASSQKLDGDASNGVYNAPLPMAKAVPQTEAKVGKKSHPVVPACRLDQLEPELRRMVLPDDQAGFAIFLKNISPERCQLNDVHSLEAGAIQCTSCDPVHTGQQVLSDTGATIPGLAIKPGQTATVWIQWYTKATKELACVSFDGLSYKPDGHWRLMLSPALDNDDIGKGVTVENEPMTICSSVMAGGPDLVPSKTISAAASDHGIAITIQSDEIALPGGVEVLYATVHDPLHLLPVTGNSCPNLALRRRTVRPDGLMDFARMVIYWCHRVSNGDIKLALRSYSYPDPFPIQIEYDEPRKSIFVHSNVLNFLSLGGSGPGSVPRDYDWGKDKNGYAVSLTIPASQFAYGHAIPFHLGCISFSESWTVARPPNWPGECGAYVEVRDNHGQVWEEITNRLISTSATIDVTIPKNVPSPADIPFRLYTDSDLLLPVGTYTATAFWDRPCVKGFRCWFSPYFTVQSKPVTFTVTAENP